MNCNGTATRHASSSAAWAVFLTALLASVSIHPAVAADGTGNPYAIWKNGPDKSADFFPIAVWLQAPKNAVKYKAIGINLYVGLWNGPTEAQLVELRESRMPVICGLNAYAAEHLDERIIVGWMHGDEPDNAQSLGRGKGYGPPIPPERIVEDFEKIKAKDPTRPVVLNLGQAVAWDGWHGRGVRTNHPEDYPRYVKGGDIISFDIYPAVHAKPAVAGKLWYVPQGVERLRRWSVDGQVTWNCIECTHIGNASLKPTPHQVKAEVWMSLIHGSKGLIYFSHQFQPRFIEAGLLADEAMARAVGAINRQIHQLAAVINSPTIEHGATVTTEPPEVTPDPGRSMQMDPVAVMMKKHEGATYLFAVRMEDKPAKATYQLKGLSGKATVEVLGEQRTLKATDGRFEDTFDPYEVHLYKIR
ncbi:MAG: hypothetical protein V3R99_01420 [Thermoguttaceae bacterium]